MDAPSYRSTLKPLEVEEPVDLALHRPLGYLVARASLPTALTAEHLTFASMAAGLGAGAFAWVGFFTGDPWLRPAAALLVLSAVLDCADGQLARMRGTSSAYGRMLDGAVDLVVQLAVVPAAVAHLWWRHGGPSPGSPGPWRWEEALGWLALAVVTVATGGAHTTLYDHFKNVFLHHVQPRRREGDDLEDVELLHREALRGPYGLAERLRFGVYLPYLRRQEALVRWASPAVPRRFRDMDGYDPARAERYRALHRRTMRAWSFYGVGTHILGLALALWWDRVEWYLLGRLLPFNLALLVLIPAQRSASRAFFQR
ncbi:MAG: CDP-alcohol phosphatidyltransferase family protein [Deltaproteobacteria bacterium]|nr:CDP-alcohol phosphatidyltransferase family protein [Deltaproteobacteria bacterium]